MYMSPRMDVRILCHRLCSARADTEAYIIDSGILTILGWLVVSPSNIMVHRYGKFCKWMGLVREGEEEKWAQATLNQLFGLLRYVHRFFHNLCIILGKDEEKQAQATLNVLFGPLRYVFFFFLFMFYRYYLWYIGTVNFVNGWGWLGKAKRKNAPKRH